MKKLNFQEMEIINGGQIMSSSAGSAYAIGSSSVTSALDPIDVVDGAAMKNCAGKGALVLLSAVCTMGGSALSGGLLTGIGWGLTAYAYYEYLDCQVSKMK